MANPTSADLYGLGNSRKRDAGHSSLGQNLVGMQLKALHIVIPDEHTLVHTPTHLSAGVMTMNAGIFLLSLSPTHNRGSIILTVLGQ